MKCMAKQEDKERVLNIARGTTYIEVNSDMYEVNVIEGSNDKEFYLYYRGDHTGLAFIERYDFEKMKVSYYGKCYYSNVDSADFLSKYGCESFDQLSLVQQCEAVFSELDFERRVVLSKLKDEAEVLYESIVGDSKRENMTAEELVSEVEEKQKFVDSVRSPMSERDM